MLQVYDRVIPTSGILTLLLLSVVLIVSLSVLALLDSIRSRLLARASVRVERLVADSVIEAGMRARRMGAPADATARDLDNLRAGITSPAAIGLLDLPWTPLFIIICFVIHFWVGVLAIVGAAIIMILALANERSSRDSISRLSAWRRASMQRATPTSIQRRPSTLWAPISVFVIAARVARRVRWRSNGSGADRRWLFLRHQSDADVPAVGGARSWAFLAVERQISPGAIIAATILTARAFAPVEADRRRLAPDRFGYTSYQALRKLFTNAPPDERAHAAANADGQARS